MSEEKHDPEEAKQGFREHLDELDERVEKRLGKGKKQFTKLTSDIRDKVDGIGDGDNTADIRKINKNLDKIEKEADDEEITRMVDEMRRKVDSLDKKSSN